MRPRHYSSDVKLSLSQLNSNYYEEKFLCNDGNVRNGYFVPLVIGAADARPKGMFRKRIVIPYPNG